MNPVYFILLPDGSREGPYCEEDLLDLIDAEEISPEMLCEEAETGERCAAGDLFAVIEPDEPLPAPRRRRPDADLNAADFPRVLRPALTPDDLRPAVPLIPAEAPKRPRLLYRSHPSLLNYWRGLAFIMLSVSAGWFAGRFNPGWVIGGLAAGSLWFIIILARRSAVEYLVTSRRIEVREGLVSESSREMRIQDIRSINVLKSGFLGILGVGTVEFASAGTEGHDLQFRGVRRAAALKNLVRKLQDRGPG